MLKTIIIFNYLMLTSVSNHSALEYRELIKAIYDNDKIQVERILKEGYDPNYAPLNESKPLRKLIMFDRYELIELLVKYGVDLEIRNEFDYTPLQQAILNRQYEFAITLLSYGADANAYSEDGNYPLTLAAVKPGKIPRDVELVDSLLKSGANPNIRTKRGFTPLGWAISSGRTEIANLLLEYNADPNAKDILKMPIELAVNAMQHESDIAMLEELIAHGANPSLAVNPRKLMETALKKSQKAYELLIRVGGEDVR